jgi:hypothetical protein
MPPKSGFEMRNSEYNDMSSLFDRSGLSGLSNKRTPFHMAAHKQDPVNANFNTASFLQITPTKAFNLSLG